MLSLGQQLQVSKPRYLWPSKVLAYFCSLSIHVHGCSTHTHTFTRTHTQTHLPGPYAAPAAAALPQRLPAPRPATPAAPSQLGWPLALLLPPLRLQLLILPPLLSQPKLQSPQPLQYLGLVEHEEGRLGHLLGGESVCLVPNTIC